MRRILGALVASVLAVAGLGVAVPPVAHAAGGTISGIVTDSAGVPIPGATLVLMGPQSTYSIPGITSDVSGRYSFSGVQPSTWRVVAQASGFATRFGNAATPDAAATISITADEVVDYPVVLPRKTAVISGRVTDPSGAPAAGVQVSVNTQQTPPFLGAGSDFNGYFGNAVTDADGRYRIADLAPSPFVVSFFPNQSSPEGPPVPSPFVQEFYPNKYAPADAVPVLLSEGATTDGIDAQLDIGATISGVVTDPSGNPVEGAGVFSPAAEYSGTTTDASGRYTIIGVPPGTAQVAALVPSPSPRLNGFYGGTDWATATQIPVALGQTITGIDIQLPAAGTVDVTVIRADGTLAAPRMAACAVPGVPYIGPTTFPGYPPQMLCTTGAASEVTGLGLLPIGVYNVVGVEAVGQFPSPVLTISDVVQLTLPADGFIDCVFVIGGVSSCLPADPTTNDGDGVSAFVEDRSPNGGDGNNDGLRDATQANVTSLPAAIGGGYATVVVAAGQRITRASINATSVYTTRSIVTGALAVSVSGVDVGGTADITVLDSGGGGAAEVLALNLSTFSVAPVPADINGATFTAHITDGSPFEQSDMGGPAGPPDGVVSTTLIPVTADAPIVSPQITCPSPAPVFAIGGFGGLTVTISDAGFGVAGPATQSQIVSTAVAGTFSATFRAYDLAGRTATANCAYTVIDDGDGVATFDELGDMNGDGIADALQSNVAPAVSGTPRASVYVVSPAGTQLSGLSGASELPAPAPAWLTQDSNFITASIGGVATGASISVDLLRQTGSGTQVWQYSSAQGWTVVPATTWFGRSTMTLTDGGLGDNDGSANGSIAFAGAIFAGDTTAPTIACDGFPTFNQRQANAIVTATASDFGSGLAGSANLSVVADTSVGGYGYANFTATDNAGNVGSTSCGYFVVADTDDDGVPDYIEDSGYNDGDGNLDGVRDSLQDSVVSSYVSGYSFGFVTVATGGAAIRGFESSDYAGTPSVDAVTQLRGGVHSFTVAGSSAVVSTSLYLGGETNTTLMLADGRWQTLPPVVNDGGVGDTDGVINGQVALTITFALVDRTPPTITCFDAGFLLLNQPSVTLYAYASDDVSGVEQNYLIVPISTATAGDRTVVVTATDLAGNSATVSCPYRVGVNLDRVIAPKPTVTAVAKGKSIIAVQWRATDYFGAPVSDPAHFVGVSTTSAPCVKGEKQGVRPVRDRGLRYLGNGKWQFDWKVPATKGCYSLQLDLVGASAVVALKVV